MVRNVSTLSPKPVLGPIRADNSRYRRFRMRRRIFFRTG